MLTSILLYNLSIIYNFSQLRLFLKYTPQSLLLHKVTFHIVLNYLLLYISLTVYEKQNASKTCLKYFESIKSIAE